MTERQRMDEAESAARLVTAGALQVDHHTQGSQVRVGVLGLRSLKAPVLCRA
ncbi:hypothetical protein [Streptomyces collinus]|uniref:hypothetical protein n=1 Tax=Streptomyces collinus TaxID=42684 RepID=UPI0036E520B3